MIEGTCDCGAVRWTLRDAPGTLTSCNCGFCRRVGALWAYGSVLTISVEGETATYLRGDRGIAFHHCPTCGATTHWQSLAPAGHPAHGRRAVNMRLADPRLVEGLPLEHLDGAGTWRSLEPGERPAIPFFPG